MTGVVQLTNLHAGLQTAILQPAETSFRVNQHLFKAAAAFQVVESDEFPLHKLLQLQLTTSSMEVETKNFRKTDSAAARFEEAVMKEVEARKDDGSEKEPQVRKRMKQTV